MGAAAGKSRPACAAWPTSFSRLDVRLCNSTCSRWTRSCRLRNAPPGLFLLLWPGAHACSDVPAIRDRLRAGGATVTMLPFLGAWPQWWKAVMAALESQLTAETVLVHHPCGPGWRIVSLLLLGLAWIRC